MINYWYTVVSNFSLWSNVNFALLSKFCLDFCMLAFLDFLLSLQFSVESFLLLLAIGSFPNESLNW